MRKAALAGKMDKLLLYASKMLEKAWLRVRDFQMEGKNVTRFAVIIDLDKVNVRQNLNIASTIFYKYIPSYILLESQVQLNLHISLIYLNMKYFYID